MKDHVNSAQELSDSINTEAPPAEQPIITGTEYNQVIDGLRMQLHLLTKSNRRLGEKLTLAIKQRDMENWTVNACASIAEMPSGWEDVNEKTHPAIRLVKQLRLERDLQTKQIAALMCEMDKSRRLLKLRKRKK